MLDGKQAPSVGSANTSPRNWGRGQEARQRQADARPRPPRRDHMIVKEPHPDSRTGCHRLGGIGQGNFLGGKLVTKLSELSP